MKSLLLLTALCWLGNSHLSAQDSAPDASPATAAPTLAVVDPANVDDLRGHEGQTVMVRGKVSKVKDWDGKGHPEKGINFLDLEGGHFTLLVFAADYDKFPAGHPAVIYRGKTLEITGALETRNGNWQIKATGPEQIKVIEAKGGAPDPKKDDQKEEKKKDDKKADKAAKKKDKDKDKADPHD